MSSGKVGLCKIFGVSQKNEGAFKKSPSSDQQYGSVTKMIAL